MTSAEHESRLSPLTESTMTPEQREVSTRILRSGRSGLGGPFTPWLHSPVLADRAQNLGAFVRFNTTFPPRLSELAILVVAARWKAQYEWFAHAPIALLAGLDAGAVEALRIGRKPNFKKTDEALLYSLASMIVNCGGLEEREYKDGIELFGEQGLVELVGIIGYYTLVAFTLNTFRVRIPEGETWPFPDADK